MTRAPLLTEMIVFVAFCGFVIKLAAMVGGA